MEVQTLIMYYGMTTMEVQEQEQEVQAGLME